MQESLKTHQFNSDGPILVIEQLYKSYQLGAVELPVLRGIGRAKELATVVGLGSRLTHRPSELSSGEQQRVAIAGALANEPNGNLDSKSGSEILNILMDIHKTGQNPYRCYPR